MADRPGGVGDEGEALIAKLRARDPDAFRLIDLLYTKRLIGLAGARLPSRIASKIGAEDVVQSVLRSFFVRTEKGEFDGLNHPESCWRVFAKITRRKCGHKADFFQAGRRNARREEDVSASWEVVARGPSPEEAAVLIETIEALGRDLEPHQARILGLLLEGRSTREAAEQAGCSRRTVERFRERLWGQFRAMLGEDAKAGPPEEMRA